MTLQEIIKDYRQKHGYSQRQLAIICDLSNGYISMLEKGINPNTKEPIVPTLTALSKLAKGMGMTLNDLLNLADDMLVDISTENNLPTAKSSEQLDEYIELFQQLSPEQQTLVISMIKGILLNQ